MVLVQKGTIVWFHIMYGACVCNVFINRIYCRDTTYMTVHILYSELCDWSNTPSIIVKVFSYFSNIGPLIYPFCSAIHYNREGALT